jgi:Na+/proline symporter
MRIYGLHLIDLLIVGGFLVALIAMGAVVSRGVRSQGDFYLGGRRMGRWLQFFLNFGNSTDSTGAVLIASEVYRQGVGGLWIGFQTLFITPFYWFTAPWYRRARLVTMADLFVDRFGSHSLASAYALFNVVVAILLIGTGNVISYKVTAAMLIKPAAEYTATERQQVELYQEYQALRAQAETSRLPDAQQARFEMLDHLNRRAPLPSFVSYLSPLPFYLGYSLVVCVYIMLGGLRAAAVTDTVQGLLIVVMSVMLIPVGLAHLGGLDALRAALPQYKLHLFGTAAMSEYEWYSILAIVLASFVQILGLSHNMGTYGSARDEGTARLGAITGNFTKRFVLIMWMLCGVIALGLFPGGLADPDHAWGLLCTTLLGPGLMGLMLAGMLLGHMPAVGTSTVAVSALVVRNLYAPFARQRGGASSLRAGQWIVPVVLGLAIVVASAFSKVITMMTALITFNTFFGAAVVLIFFWRRLTARAILIGLAVWIVLMGVVPWSVPHWRWFRQLPSATLQTHERITRVIAGATTEDVTAGRAERVGQPIARPHLIRPVGVFFESVARVNANDASTPLEGIGRFHVENFILHHLGLPLDRFGPAGLLAARWFFAALFPFLLLMGVSWLGQPGDPVLAARFYAKMKTPVAAKPEADQAELARSQTQPDRFDHQKLFPGSQWEFTRWARRDYLGFAACWGLVGAILLLLTGLLAALRA